MISEVKIVSVEYEFRCNEHVNDGRIRCLEKLQENVNKEIQNGWVPYGTPMFDIYQQQMVRYTKTQARMLTGYKILYTNTGPQTDDYIRNIELEINTHLKDGWQLLGDLCHNSNIRYIQGLIKYEVDLLNIHSDNN
jgi:hypothetical protein